MNTALLLLAAILPAQAPDTGDFEAFFETFGQKRAEIRVLEADIQEETIQFGDRSLRHGKLTFGKPRRILFRYGIDEPSIMIDGRRVYEFDPLEEQVQLYDIDESPESSIFFLGFDTDPAALREAYDVRVFSMQSAQGNHGIEIRPYKENQDQAPFQEVTIYLRDDDYLPYRIDIEFDDDTRMVTEFTNYQVNQPLDPAQTQLKIPAGTRVIENGEVTLREVPPGGLLMPPDPLETGAPKNIESPAPAPAEAAETGALQVRELPTP